MDLSHVIWRKSSRSLGNTEECVEIAAIGDAVGIRDSKHPTRGHHLIGQQEFRTLVSRIKRGEQPQGISWR
jgi:hypothetical protein